MPLPACDLRHAFHHRLLERWQLEWDQTVDNKLQAIKPRLGVWSTSSCPSRLEERAFARLRIGHSHLTHGYLLSGRNPPNIEHCGERLSIQHILVDCVHYAPERMRFDLPADMSLLLGDDRQILDRVLLFLRHLNVLHAL